MTHAALPATRDNLFGICAAVGEDFGFNPLWLRIGFAVALLFALEAVLVGYAALGVVVVASRLLFPNARTMPTAPALADVVAAPEPEEVEFRRAA